MKFSRSPRIGEPPFLLDRQQGEPVEQRRRKESRGRRALGVPSAPYVFTRNHPAARRILLEHVAAEAVAARKLVEALARPVVHAVGVIDAGADRDHPRSARTPPVRTRRSVSRGVPSPISTSGHTGTHSTCGPRTSVRKSFALVAAVEPHLLSEEARGDPDPDSEVPAAFCGDTIPDPASSSAAP